MYLYLNIDNIIIDIVNAVTPVYKNINNIIIPCNIDKAQGFMGTNEQIYPKVGINLIPSFVDIFKTIEVEEVPDYVVPRMYKYEDGVFSKAEHYELSNAQLTPYTDTKIGYYGETEKTFYNVPKGIVSIYIDDCGVEYSFERIEDRLIIRFAPLTKQTEITISVL